MVKDSGVSGPENTLNLTQTSRTTEQKPHHLELEALIINPKAMQAIAHPTPSMVACDQQTPNGQ